MKPHPSLSEFKIKGIAEGSLYRGRIERVGGGPFAVDGKAVTVWETLQHTEKDVAVGQAVYAIETGRVTI